jgi:hypothetical protein
LTFASFALPSRLRTIVAFYRASLALEIEQPTISQNIFNHSTGTVRATEKNPATEARRERQVRVLPVASHFYSPGAA